MGKPMGKSMEKSMRCFICDLSEVNGEVNEKVPEVNEMLHM